MAGLPHFSGDPANKACYRTSMGIRELRRRSDAAAATFDSADFLQAHTRDGLLERLRPVTVDATLVLDLGTATGSAVPLLARRLNSRYQN